MILLVYLLFGGWLVTSLSPSFFGLNKQPTGGGWQGGRDEDAELHGQFRSSRLSVSQQPAEESCPLNSSAKSS